MKKSFFIFIIAIFLALTGCKGENKDVSQAGKKNDQIVQENKEETKPEPESESATESEKTKEDVAFFKDLPDVPKTAGDLIHQSAGQFADQDVFSEEAKVIEEIKDMPPLSEDASEEEYEKYFQYVYAQVATDFPNPEDLINKWEYSMSGDPAVKDGRFTFKENYNVEVILDASGSMAHTIGGKTMMELAKEAISKFLASVPEEANVSLRVYGHKGTGSESDKKLSCSSIEQVYGFGKYEEAAFKKSLNKFQPSGWTPLARALEESKKALAKFDAKTNTNLIYVVSDGIETCGGNPVEVAKSFADSNVSPIINVIGFNVDSESQKQLKEMAKISNGVYTTVNNGDQLQDEFERASKVMERWEEWKSDSHSDADNQRVENSFDILGFSNDWGSRADTQNLNISYFLSIMEEEEKINMEQRDFFNKRSIELENLVNQAQKDVVNDLEKLNIEKIDELKKQIDEKYRSNT
ncbi:VWA domain-containing protein [Lederbergia citrea]|uniref:VWA domain-containing protein n=1 Tax=Lederbergia citrea TaxID=2833581 RepID=UPI001BCA1D18|nr:VWA domain-containing protein [Lederbergia citrea]MBS4206163.1 VWA domain-containing protein [Lederbergia citrea]